MPTKGGAYGITNIRAGQLTGGKLTGGSKKYSNAVDGHIRGKPLSTKQKAWLKLVKEAGRQIKAEHIPKGEAGRGAVMKRAQQLRDGK